MSADHEVHVEWGPEGLQSRIDDTDVFVVVDVLSFSTCVDVALDLGAWIVPSEVGPHARELAASLGGVCATTRGAGRYSLSPLSYLGVGRGEVIVLPSPNGATLCLQTREIPTFTACLRNAAAVAGAAVQMGRRITVVAAGERWPNGALRPALEDWLGAGAVVARMAARRSPEAAAAEMAFGAARTRMVATLVACQSGRELIERGYEGDVRCAADLDATRRAPILVDGTFLAVDP